MKSLFSSLLPLAFLLFLLSLLTSSCSRHSSTSDGPIRTIRVDVNLSQSSCKSSKVLKDVHVIPLETSDDCLIADVKKIMRFGDVLYVSDGLAVYRFDSHGHLLSSIKRRGKDHEDYIRVYDFDVDKDGIVYILSGYECNVDRICLYTETGEFIRKINMKC